MAKPEEFINDIFNSFGKGIDFYKVVLELPQEQQQEVFDIALFIRRQQDLEVDARLGLLNEKDLKMLKQAESALEKHFSRLQKIINLNKENSSWI